MGRQPGQRSASQPKEPEKPGSEKAPHAGRVSSPKNQRFSFDIALVIAVVPVAGAAVRIWMYSGGDISLFLVLLRTLNVPAVLIGTCVLMIPPLLIVLLVSMLTDRAARSRITGWLAQNPWATGVMLPIVFVVAAYTIDWRILVFVAGISTAALAIYAIRSVAKRRRAKSGPVRAVRRVRGADPIAVLLSVLAVFLVTPGNMWLPLETLSIEGDEARVGFVLESTAEWTTILTEEREVQIVATSTLESRSVCSTSNAGTLAMSIQRADPTGSSCDE
jgi:hypothetical protein